MKKRNNIILFLAVLTAFSFCGCASTGKRKGGSAKVALVFGGGAARGFAHVGVIRVLEQEGIPVDMIIGTSVGSLIGAMYSAMPDSFELEWKAFKLKKKDIFDFSLLSSKTGPINGDRLEKFVKSIIPSDDIKDLKIPFYAIAADLNTGERIILDRGPVSKAVRASCSIPGVFTPLRYMDRTMVDGGILGNIAPEVARLLGADIIIAVDIGRDITNYDVDNVIKITMQAMKIMNAKITRYKMKEIDVLIEPEVGGVKMMDFSQKKKCMAAGIKATKEAIPKIKSILKKYKK